MVTPPMLTSSEPVISNPRDASPNQDGAAATRHRGDGHGPDEPSVEPHDVVCVPGKSKTVRVAEVDVASADDTESHAAANRRRRWKPTRRRRGARRARRVSAPSSATTNCWPSSTSPPDAIHHRRWIRHAREDVDAPDKTFLAARRDAADYRSHPSMAYATTSPDALRGPSDDDLVAPVRIAYVRGRPTAAGVGHADGDDDGAAAMNCC